MSNLTKLANRISQLFFHHKTVKGYLEPVIQIFKPAWRDGYFRAQLIDIKMQSNDVVAIELQPETHWPLHQAGQHLMFTIELNGRLVTRTFTIASSPEQALHQRIIRLLIKQQAQGAFTQNLMSQLKSGMICNISRPYGEFTLVQKNKSSVFIAGGSGITPFIAMLHEHLPSYNRNIELLYYAKANSHLLSNELAALARQYKHFNVKLLTRSHHGDVTEQLKNYNDHDFYVCGPQPLYEQVVHFCQQNKYTLHSEHFAPLAKPIANQDQQTITITHNGEQFDVDQNQSLLMQFKQQGIRVNSGCGMGICHQCQCLKRKGMVRDIRNGQLSDMGEELIQLCISQVVTQVELES